MTKIENPAIRRLQGTSKKIFKAVIDRYFIIYHAIVKSFKKKLAPYPLNNLNGILAEKRAKDRLNRGVWSRVLQEQLEGLNIILFEKRRGAGFVEGGR